MIRRAVRQQVAFGGTCIGALTIFTVAALAIWGYR